MSLEKFEDRGEFRFEVDNKLSDRLDSWDHRAFDKLRQSMGYLGHYFYTVDLQNNDHLPKILFASSHYYCYV